MYRNDGNDELNIPPHWHYITFGLSDLHGDGRVHVCDDMDNPEQRSGMGSGGNSLDIYNFQIFTILTEY